MIFEKAARESSEASRQPCPLFWIGSPADYDAMIR